jgi:glycosyltransferase involved in cell wall biosynthesis
MSPVTALRVCVDARLASGHSGGVEQVVVGLAAALSKLDDGDEEYLFLVHPDEDGWLEPHLSGPCRLLHTRMEYPGQLGLARGLRRGLRNRNPFAGPAPLQRSDGTAERAGAEVVHFTMQEAFLTDVPSIYQPHDLQHLHLPEMFPAAERQRRERVYRAFCEQAELVAVMTEWGKRDLVAQYGLAPSKIAVVPWGSILADRPPPSPAEQARTRERLGLPERFILFPAQTWPHKNHAALLEAVAILRAEGIEVPLVCPGTKNSFYAEIERRASELELSDLVHFPGFVGSPELLSLYALATALVFPSRFEGWGLPVTEAFSAGLPVACSAIPVLEEVAGDAALTFDPESPEQIADCVRRLWADEGLRRDLIGRGRARAKRFSFVHTARLFRSYYRRIAGRQLSDEDRILTRDGAD